MRRQTLTKSELHIEDRVLDSKYSLLGASGGGCPKPSFSWLCTGESGQTWATTLSLSKREGKPCSLETFLLSRIPKDMTDEIHHPTAGRRRRHKSPAAVPVMHDLHLPSLPDHLRTDADGPSCSDDEKGAKRLRSTSTTPRSVRGTDPDDYDRAMGVTSVGSRETMRFGEENDLETEENLDGVAHNSIDLDETQGDELQNDVNPGVDETLRGYGNASLIECLGGMGAQPNTTAPATCQSEGGQGEAPPHQTDLPHFATLCNNSRRFCDNLYHSRMKHIVAHCDNLLHVATHSCNIASESDILQDCVTLCKFLLHFSTFFGGFSSAVCNSELF